MRQISPLKAGVSVGATTGLLHLIWVTLVGFGWLKPMMDFILRLHFIDFDYQLFPFSFETAATLVMLTTFFGLFVGLVFAVVWNWLTFESAPQWERDTNANQPGSLPPLEAPPR